MSEGDQPGSGSAAGQELFRWAPALDGLAGGLLFALGTAVARYMGIPIDGAAAGLGLFLVVTGQIGLHFLRTFRRRRSEAAAPAVALPIRPAARLPFLGMALFLTLWATGVSAAIQRSTLPPLAWALLGLGSALAVGLALPSTSLTTTGVSEILHSTLMAAMLPGFAFAIQSPQLPLPLVLTVAPLVAFHFAMLIVLQLRSYGRDGLVGRKTLSVQIGWPRAMRLHDLALVLGLALIAVGAWFGVPRRVSLGMLLVLPLALAQIWQMERLRRGFPARWGTLGGVAMATFGLALYLELTGYVLAMA